MRTDLVWTPQGMVVRQLSAGDVERRPSSDRYYWVDALEPLLCAAAKLIRESQDAHQQDRAEGRVVGCLGNCSWCRESREVLRSIEAALAQGGER
jgi:hypothetical protein